MERNKIKKPLAETRWQTRQAYVVHAHERGEGSSILKVFSTKEDAEEFAARQPQNQVDLIVVEEVAYLAPAVAEREGRRRVYSAAAAAMLKALRNARNEIDALLGGKVEGGHPDIDDATRSDLLGLSRDMGAAIDKAEGRTP